MHLNLNNYDIDVHKDSGFGLTCCNIQLIIKKLLTIEFFTIVTILIKSPLLNVLFFKTFYLYTLIFDYASAL